MVNVRRWLPVVLVGVLVAGGAAGPGSPAAAVEGSGVEAGVASGAPAPLAVTGFALGDLPHRVLRRDGHALRTVTVDGVLLGADGRRVSAPTREMVSLARAAERRGLRSELLLSNYSGRLQDFDPRAAHRLLSSPAAVRRLARTLARQVRAQGWDGVNVDLERVPARDAGGLATLVEALQAAMPAARTVSIDVSAATSVRGYRRQGYALGRLARAADVVAVMTYDQHGPGWSGPGPVGGLGWQRAALRALLTQVPAEQVDLGVAGYGYTWPRRGTGGPLAPRAARARVAADGARAVWNARAGEWTARLSDGTVLWWSDARSYRLRAQLARRHGLHGLALWRLGSADPLP